MDAVTEFTFTIDVATSRPVDRVRLEAILTALADEAMNLVGREVSAEAVSRVSPRLWVAQ